jgi:16S rRNA (guanine527-N7)-methyltransferase
MDIILKYFPDITEEQKNSLQPCMIYTRNGMQKSTLSHAKTLKTCMSTTCYTRWLLHVSYSSAPDLASLDLGTGGGFPGIPLAILFPEVHFHLVDSMAKRCGWLRRWLVPLA